MSLKAFHVFFIAVATLFSAGFGVWSFRHAATTGSALDIVFGATGILGAVALVVYGVWFLKKLKKVSYV